MAKIRIRLKVEEREWAALRQLAHESNRPISALLSEAVADYVRKRRMRPELPRHLKDSISKNAELGKLLAR